LFAGVGKLCASYLHTLFHYTHPIALRPGRARALKLLVAVGHVSVLAVVSVHYVGKELLA